jgi:hypothetical protein
MLGLQQFFLALPGRIGDLEPSRCGPDAHPIRLECQDAGIVAVVGFSCPVYKRRQP